MLDIILQITMSMSSNMMLFILENLVTYEQMFSFWKILL